MGGVTACIQPQPLHIFLCLLVALFSASCEYAYSNLLPSQPGRRSCLFKENSQLDCLLDCLINCLKREAGLGDTAAMDVALK